MSEQPALSYPEPGGQTYTSGHSGSEASRERAVHEDSTGVTAKRQALVLDLVQTGGPLGLTVRVLRDVADLHHGQASSALSNLHKAGRIARLQEKRMGCHVYVTPENVNGRPTDEPGRQNLNRLNAAEQEVYDRVKNQTEHGWVTARFETERLLRIIERLTQ